MEQDVKFARFLQKLDLVDLDRFDMSFDMAQWDIFDKNTFRMIIRKSTAWDYETLFEFLNSLYKLDFKYLIEYVYDITPTATDTYKLFSSWFFVNKLYPPMYDYDLEDNRLILKAKDEKEAKEIESAILEFKPFLDRINYPTKLEMQKSEIAVNLALNQELLKEALIEDITYDESEDSDEDEDVDEETKATEEEDAILAYESRKVALQLEAEADILQELRVNKSFLDKERHSKNNQYLHVLISNIVPELNRVDFDAEIFSVEERVTKKNSLMVTLGVADDSGAIYVRVFESSRLKRELLKKLKRGMQIRIRGEVQIDRFSNELIVMGNYINIFEESSETLRVDLEEEKRVELHLHTKMSTMDGLTVIGDYCKLAKHMGHKAIAVTDHGVVQSFPQAQSASSKTGVKMLYGCELYMIDNDLNAVQNPAEIELDKATYVVFDFETTGLSARYDDIIEFGAIKFSQGNVVKSVDILINPQRKISDKITKLTGINDEMLIGKPTIQEAMKDIRDFIGDSILVSHNAEFDMGFLQVACRKLAQPIFNNPVVDTLPLSRYLFPDARAHRLGALCRNLEIPYDDSKAHRADYDARVLNDVWQAIIAKFTKDKPNFTHADLAKLTLSDEHLKHLRPKHVIALAKNQDGLKDLFKLISFSHLNYFADVPKIPRKLVTEYRKNLLLGSACFNGEVFDSAMTKSAETLQEKIEFYDYIEVQPMSNYSYLVNMGNIESEDKIKQFVRDIIDAASKHNKLVVATGDAHYLNPSDKKYRDVFISAKGIGNTNHPMSPYARDDMDYFENPNQHYRTTREMLDDFAWLGEKLAKEIVVTNTNIIADMIEVVKPIKDKLYTPKIENCEEMLKDLCYKTAYETYGNPLPEIVADRLEKELSGVMKNKYSVIYYIAHKIVKKAMDDGFLVGSRGSVGSSFVATMSGITEVNPLPPHYRCPKCFHTEFVMGTDIKSGYDLPNKKCPECGHELIRDGQGIPFATFLGFNAEKVPDIDLNFPGDYQAIAHSLTKDLLGEANVYKAGTIETVADKTAFGYVKGYFERVGAKIGKDLSKVTKAEIAYLAVGCTDVRRTTGQHPGGIIVIPEELEVFDFTPIQYPADDKEATWKTTHFDFHAIHDNVLKLDLLGHVDPMALKLMGDMSGVDVLSIPMNDKDVISLFSTDQALKRHSNYLNESTGALGLPEFGTDLTRSMLKETCPRSFADLLIISGLSHGTGVWKGNAQELIKSGNCTLREVIGCRDDIMTYLSDKGVDPLTSFAIMEDVRKGKKVKEEYATLMRANNVPEYYIDSCNRIEYMFPKAHAVAYVMMAIRVGWFKVHRPLVFYAAFFSLRSRQFDLHAMMSGEKAIIAKLEDFKERAYDLSVKEKDIEKTLIIALEMAERGFKFSPINLYKSDAINFIVDEETGTIIPPFSAIDGLGENAALTIIEARKNGEFLSKQDLSNRTKVNSQSMTRLDEFNVLKGLDETNQMSLFSFFDID